MGQLIPFRQSSSEPAALSAEALLAASGTGDRAALGGLFDRFHVAVYRFVSRLPGVDELGRDDLVQATFLEIPRSAAQFQGHSSVKTWILGVAANVARHHVRSETRRRKHQGHFASVPPSSPDQPDTEADRRRLLLRIAEVLSTLPHDQQTAFILCDLEQLPGVEVARVLDVPEGTLWRRLHMARKAMRAALTGGQS